MTTQQADAAVEMIAARLGGEVTPAAFQPLLRGMLLTGIAPTYLRTAVTGDVAEDYHSALRWLEVVERLDGVLPPGYLEKRTEWRDRAQG